IYANLRPLPDLPVAELAHDFTPLVYGYAVYETTIALAGLTLLLRSALQPHGLYRAQTALIAVGFFIPVLGTLVDLTEAINSPQYDLAPFAFAAGNLIIAWGLFRFQIFEVAPIARDKVFEALVEPVVILNNQNLIVDINSSMLDLMGETARNVIGKPAREVFADFPIPIKQHTQTSYARAEAIFEIGGKEIHYELTVWPIYGADKRMTGRIFISHDITALKDIEQDLHKINTELEDRVRARTRELEEAYGTTLEGWARTLELRDKETEGHTRRVTDMTLKIAVRMKISGEDLEHLRRGAILHDIGKMGIPDNILLKPGKLTKAERAVIEEHAEMAYKLLLPIPFLNKALDIPYCHHEKWD
ncbi:MAG: HD domain-containing protein, partial [Anaerolineales bacterium]|nr:HD domain-containing protein [Anaerolineales bacterium]